MVLERPLRIGLTGSIGMGKTETARMFARFGAAVYDADACVHALYAPGGAAVAPIAATFPGAVTDGRVDRAALARYLEAHPDAFARLEAIVHPLVAAKEQQFLASAAAQSADMVVLDIPLLFETGGEKRMDAVVVVSAPAELQRERALARPGMTPDYLDRILARQMPDIEKRSRADFVVDTGSGFAHAFEQVRTIVAALRQRARNA